MSSRWRQNVQAVHITSTPVYDPYGNQAVCQNHVMDPSISWLSQKKIVFKHLGLVTGKINQAGWNIKLAGKQKLTYLYGMGIEEIRCEAKGKGKVENSKNQASVIIFL